MASSSRSPDTGAAPRSRTLAAAASERASARTSQPSARSRSIRAPPTKPEPPVTNAVGMGASYSVETEHIGQTSASTAQRRSGQLAEPRWIWPLTKKRGVLGIPPAVPLR